MKNKLTFCFWMFISMLSLTTFSSCDDNDVVNASDAPPVITKVSASLDEDGQPTNLEAITQGYANNMYIIQGSGFSTVSKIYFNDTDTAFNPNLVTDTSIFVVIDINTPYANASNKLRVVTKNGTAEFDFVVAPPAPSISSINPINVADGSQITIKGAFFLNPIVKVGGVNATVVSNTLTEIVATIPTGSQLKSVTVTTISGTASYGSAIGTAFFDDAFYFGITSNGGWGETHVLNNTSPTEVVQGNNAIKCTINSWSGFQVDGYVPMAVTATGLRFKMKMATDGQIRLVLNYNWNNQHYMDITSAYKEYFVTWDKFGLTGPPVAFQSLVFGSTGSSNIFYIDDFGFTVN